MTRSLAFLALAALLAGAALTLLALRPICGGSEPFVEPYDGEAIGV